MNSKLFFSFEHYVILIIIPNNKITPNVYTTKALHFSNLADALFQSDLQWLAKVFTPIGIFPILLPYNLELKLIFLGGVVSFDLHNMPTTLKMQNIFCETYKK